MKKMVKISKVDLQITKATEKPAYPPGVNPQRLALGGSAPGSGGERS